MGQVEVVFDTNVLVSGIGFGGKPWQCLLLAFVGDVEMVTSQEALDEFERVLGYERLPFTREERDTFPGLLGREATVIDPDVDVNEIDADPDDDLFLECAVAGDVDYLISGNDHVLDVDTYEGVEIVTPDEFLGNH